MATIAVDGEGNTLDDVAPDLGKAYGQSYQRRKRLSSSNPVVQNSIGTQDYSRGNTIRLLQQTLGLNPDRELVDFFRNLDEDSKKDFLRVWKVMRKTLENKTIATSLGVAEDEDHITKKLIEIGTLKDDLVVTVNNAKRDITQVNGALSRLTEQLKKALSNAQTEVSQNIKDVTSNADRTITSFITSHTAKIESIESKIKEMLAKATVTTLSSKYDEKRNALNKNYLWAKGIFYACLFAFFAIGMCAVRNASVMAGSDITVKIVKTILTITPYYLPLFWFTCHINKLMNQNRRLMEEYAHKVAVAQTYVGMAEQVEELSKKGVKDADDLSAELMDDTIKVLCANPNECLDKVKTSTPISEVVDSVSKLMRATAQLKQATEK